MTADRSPRATGTPDDDQAAREAAALIGALTDEQCVKIAALLRLVPAQNRPESAPIRPVAGQNAVPGSAPRTGPLGALRPDGRVRSGRAAQRQAQRAVLRELLPLLGIPDGQELPPVEIDPALLRVEMPSAAVLLGVTEATVLKYVKRGWLTAHHRPGSREVQFDLDELRPDRIDALRQSARAARLSTRSARLSTGEATAPEAGREIAAAAGVSQKTVDRTELITPRSSSESNDSEDDLDQDQQSGPSR